MSFLIDGYNLLFAAGMMPRHVVPGSLHRARHVLLDYLVSHLTAQEIRETIVVFDAKDAPRRLPHEVDHRGLRVLFSRDHEEADDLIEQLIRLESVPRRLCVITSDLRLRTAASRRRSKAIKSEDWLDQIERRQPSEIDSVTAANSNPVRQPKEAGLMSDDELRAWLDVFGLDAEQPAVIAETLTAVKLMPQLCAAISSSPTARNTAPARERSIHHSAAMTSATIAQMKRATCSVVHPFSGK